MTNTVGDSIDLESQTINLSKLAPAKVVGLITNVNRVDHMYISGVIHKLEIPHEFKDTNLLKACIWHLQSAKFNLFQPNTKDKDFGFATGLFDFIVNAPEHLRFNVEIPVDIAYLYLIHCSKLKYSASTIRKKVGFIRLVIDNLRSEKHKAKTSDITYKIWDENFSVMLTKIPPFTKHLITSSNAVTDTRDNATTVSKKGLSEIFPDCPYNSTELINSIRTFSHWMLMELKKQREVLLGISEVKITLDELLKNHTAQESPVSGLKQIKTKNSTTTKHEHQALYHTLVYAALATNDPLLLERVYLDIDYDDVFDPESDRDQVKMKCFIDNKSIDGHFKSSIVSIQNTTFANLIVPSPVEVLIFSWLLASERCQRSGVFLAKTEHMSFSKAGVQFFYYKDRINIEAAPENPSPIYKRNTPIHEVYRYWVDFIRSAKKHLPTEYQGSLCPNFKYAAEIARIRTNARPSALIRNMAVPKSVWRKKYIDKVGVNAKPFLWFLDQIIRSNTQLVTGISEYNKDLIKYRSRGLTGVKPICKQYCKGTSWISISTDAIARTRVQMDDGVEVRVKDGVIPQEFDPNSLIEIKTRLLAHSETTHKNIYGNNSNSVEKIASMKKFAAQVGDLMEADANKIQHLMDNSKVIDLNELKQTLGLEKPIDSLESLLNETDESGLLGEIKYNGIKYFVATDLTSALIQGYIKHIEQSIPKARLESEKLAKSLLLESMYLSEVLSSFPQSMIKEGKTLLDTHNFPYPSVI